MFLKKFTFGVVGFGVFLLISGYTIGSDKIRVCNNEQCRQTTELINIKDYNNEDVVLATEEEKELTLFEYITFLMTLIVPITGFMWWLVNSQQEKKILDFSQAQDVKFKLLIKELMDKQDENNKIFSHDVKELIAKLDRMTQNFQDSRLEYVERLGVLNEKISNIVLEIKMLQSYIDKIDNIEGFINKKFDDYHIRN